MWDFGEYPLENQHILPSPKVSHAMKLTFDTLSTNLLELLFLLENLGQNLSSDTTIGKSRALKIISSSESTPINKSKKINKSTQKI